MLRASVGTVLALLCAVGATGAGALTANASPSAAADTFTVVSAGAAAANPDQLTVVVDSPATITGLTARLLAGSTDELDPVLTQQAPAPTDPAGQTTWTAVIPVGTSPTGLALGDYTVSLDATFSDSGTGSATAPGLFGFLAQPTVTLTAASTTLTYPSVTAGLSGTVTLAYPDGTPDTTYTGVGVNILVGGQVVEQLPVDGSGNFADAKFTPLSTETVTAQATGLVTGETSSPVTLTVTTVKPKLTASASPSVETYGKPVTVSGTLTYPVSSGSVIVPNAQISVATNPGESPIATGTTGLTTGKYNIKLPVQSIGTTLYVTANSVPGLPSVTTTLPLNVAYPTEITSFKVSLSQYWRLSVSGCLSVTFSNQSVYFYRSSGLTVQYAQSSKGPWKKLAAINPNESGSYCKNTGIAFKGTFNAPENYAYYRVVYAGVKPVSHGIGFSATNSITRLAWKYDDRIVSAHISPTVVNAGGKLTVKGTLQYYYSGWHNYAGQTVIIILRPKGSSTWYYLRGVNAKTNSRGQFSATFKDPVSATWAAEYEGSSTHLSAVSSQVYVRLK
jgi:hypothetical protein